MTRYQLIAKREAKGHSRPQASKISGLSIGTLKGIELYNVSPTIPTLIKVIDYYELSLKELCDIFSKPDYELSNIFLKPDKEDSKNACNKIPC